MPVYKLASKILCRVINVSLKTLMKYLHKSLYFLNQIFQNGYVTLCYSSYQNGEGLHGCHSSNRKKVSNRTIGRQKGYNCYDWIEHGISTQLLQTLFKVKGVVHYGIAGNADPQLEIGDVIIPQFWAHTDLWNWQSNRCQAKSENGDEESMPKSRICS